MINVDHMQENEVDDDDEDIVEFSDVFEGKAVVRKYGDVRVVVGIFVLASSRNFGSVVFVCGGLED